ncbi:MAG: PAS domain-containing protein [Anaerolineales bacterium]|nr:PAS domain-containing protein [Anaerolineales bacterium]
MLPDFRVRQRDYLLEIARAITQELNLDEVLARILQHAAELLAGQAGLVALRGAEGGWNVAAYIGIPDQLLSYLDPLLAEVPDYEEAARFEIPEVNRLLQTLAREVSLGLLSGVGLPLIVQNRVLGVIFVFRNYRGLFSREDQLLLQSFADQAAIAVHNAQLYDQSRGQAQRLDGLLNSVADGILILQSGHVVERCNPAFARLVGQRPADIIGKQHGEIITWKEVTHGPTLERAEAGGWPLTPTATLYVEGDLRRSDGSGLPVGVTYAPLLNPEGQLINIIASVRDVSHFRQAEQMQSTFISVISHELKTPVSLIKGYVGTLRRPDVRWDSKVVQDSLEVIEEEADRLAELIENLLDASRLEAGALALNASDLALPLLAERIAERFRTQTDKHRIVLDFPEEFPVVLGDEQRLGQVLLNLLSNAVKYSPQGGEVRIIGQVRPEHVVICVQDEGPGIPHGDMPHIFDRFYRAGETARSTKGAGLGLYLTRAILEAHGGSIWVDAQYKEGARVCFSLPRPQ